MVSQCEDEWVWGWDSTPGIVSVWADLDGRASVWRGSPGTGELFRQNAISAVVALLVLDWFEDLQPFGDRLALAARRAEWSPSRTSAC